VGKIIFIGRDLRCASRSMPGCSPTTVINQALVVLQKLPPCNMHQRAKLLLVSAPFVHKNAIISHRAPTISSAPS
jgi:hypothetical protein